MLASAAFRDAFEPVRLLGSGGFSFHAIGVPDAEHGRTALGGLEAGRPYRLSLVPREQWGGLRQVHVVSGDDRLGLDDEGKLDYLVSALASTPMELARFARDLRDRKSADLALRKAGRIRTPGSVRRSPPGCWRPTIRGPPSGSSLRLVDCGK